MYEYFIIYRYKTIYLDLSSYNYSIELENKLESSKLSKNLT